MYINAQVFKLEYTSVTWSGPLKNPSCPVPCMSTPRHRFPKDTSITWSRSLKNPSCPVPCMSSPCQHSGSCQEVMMAIPALNINIDDFGGYQCQCPPPFTGPNCQVRHNPCVWPVAPGNCDLQLGRFFYDRVTQQCLPFNYTGALLLLFFHI